MTPHSNETQGKGPVDMPTGWLDLTRRMRLRFDSLQRGAEGTPLEQEVKILARDAGKLCDHVEHLHRETHRWISENSGSTDERATDQPDVDVVEVEKAAVNIQREQHEQSGSTMQVIKALLMWVDTPEERVREVDNTQASG